MLLKNTLSVYATVNYTKGHTLIVPSCLPALNSLHVQKKHEHHMDPFSQLAPIQYCFFVLDNAKR